ncbi:MAG TPA: alkaline phosphatase family protein [Terriglobales bacterium]|nr:alkaline phosphatase family protein [Terriglobales bacterium]
MLTKKYVWIVCLLAACAAGLLTFISCERPHGASNSPRMIVIGVDGLDPDLLIRYMADGKMPNFARLAQQGSFKRLTTAIPPQSPVAWSNLITGMNAGGHGIFDFIHRDPKTFQPYFSTSKVEGPAHSFNIGKWVIPLGSGSAEELRKGAAFWEILDQNHIHNYVYRIPANFPPIDAKGRTLSGMGTPDLRGTYGTFTFYTDDATAAVGAVEGGEIIQVEVKNNRVTSNLLGPNNTFLKDAPPATEPFTVDIDPLQPVARIRYQDQKLVLKEGEWTGWLPVEFHLMPVIGDVKGICRFYLKQTHPRFQLYVSPINIDPENPALPISTPSSYSRDLAREIGEYHTQGIAEDTKARMVSVLDDKEYLEQAHTVLAEHRRAFDAEFPKFHDGFFFFYFSSLDLNGHMLWRLTDPQSPLYDAAAAAQYGGALEEFYEQIDKVIGEILPKLDDNTTLLVLSDHGFAPYRRSFNLNTWLLNNGYIVRKPGAGDEPFAGVDWSQTRAYGMGLNGLYVNMKGREKNGIVDPAQADALMREIRDKLLQIRDPQVKDPKIDSQVISRVDLASEVYQGPYAHSGPDALVGYNRGYRAGWTTILGQFPVDELEDNMNPWSGDHCMDYTKVPGVLLSNRKIALDAPALTDIAPTILAQYGIAKPKEMQGGSVFQSK